MAHLESFDPLARRIDPAGVVVIASTPDPGAPGDGPRPSGCFVGFHSQCSIDPPRWCLWLSRKNHTYRVAREADRLDVVVLADSDIEVAGIFGGTTGDEVDKWALMDEAGVSLPPDGFSGRIVGLIDVDGCDHVGFIVEPDAARSTGEAAVLRISQLDHVEPGHEA